MLLKLLARVSALVSSASTLVAQVVTLQAKKRVYVLLFVVVLFAINMVSRSQCKADGYIGPDIDACVERRLEFLIDSSDELVLNKNGINSGGSNVYQT